MSHVLGNVKSETFYLNRVSYLFLMSNEIYWELTRLGKRLIKRLKRNRWI